MLHKRFLMLVVYSFSDVIQIAAVSRWQCMFIYVCQSISMCALCVCVWVCLSRFKILDCKNFGEESEPQAKTFSIFATYFSWNGNAFFDVNHILKKVVRLFFHWLFGQFIFSKKHVVKPQDLITNKSVCKLQCLSLEC